MTTFSVIGAGRLGTSLADILTRRGWVLKIIADRDAMAARQSRKIIGRGTPTADILRAGPRADVLFICVPDDAVARVAQKLARPDTRWSGKFVFHTSGILPAAVLEPLRRRGAFVASFHPVRSFPRKEKTRGLFPGVFWGVEGDREAVAAARRIVRAIGGHTFLIAEKNRPVYHAACSLASNGFVSLEGAATALLQGLGFGSRQARAILMPLVEGTLQNVKDFGAEAALTGPVSRGDSRTVRQHLEALKPFPCEWQVYKALALQALALMAGRKLSAGKVRTLRRLLGDRQPPLRARPRTSSGRVP